jgi:AcrR family transcriptional regulator
MPGVKAPEDRRREQILAASCRVALRSRVAGLSTRAVAAEAGISNGLLFFHFGNREGLLLALLDWLLAHTILGRAGARTGAKGSAAATLAAEVREDIECLHQDREKIALFFDYWFMSSQDQKIRRRIRLALRRYRESYIPLARNLIEENPAPYGNLTPESVAGLVTGFIEGCALELIAEPRAFDAKARAQAVVGLLLRPGHPQEGGHDPEPRDAAGDLHHTTRWRRR